MIKFEDIYKGGDLHTHFSSIVLFDDIIDKIQDEKLEKYLFYKIESNELYFDFEKKSRDPCFRYDSDKILKSIGNFFFFKTNRI